MTATYRYLLIFLLGFGCLGVGFINPVRATVSGEEGPQTMQRLVPGGRDATHRHDRVEAAESTPAVATDIAWVHALILGIMWIFIAAVLLGPIAAWLQFDPWSESNAPAVEDHGGENGH